MSFSFFFYLLLFPPPFPLILQSTSLSLSLSLSVCVALSLRLSQLHYSAPVSGGRRCAPLSSLLSPPSFLLHSFIFLPS